jgi:hypothetical protein
MNNLKKNNIYNSNNYNDVLPSISKILASYLEIVNEYVVYTIENIKLKGDMLDYILNRGLKILKHIFLILLLYTKNLNLVLYHGKKSYLYFVEFIDQIGEDNHSYLQLTSKDAVLFVYKKTIFEINNEYKTDMKLTDVEKTEFKKIGNILKVFNEVIYSIIKKNKDNYKKNILDTAEINQKIITLCKKNRNTDVIYELLIILNKIKDKDKLVEYLHKFISLYARKNLTNDLNTIISNDTILLCDIKNLFK